MSKPIIKIEKIVVNCSLSEMSRDEKLREQVMKDLAIITGQKPILRNAKKAIAGFKIREGVPIGAKITLRGKRMRHFVERLVKTALPRTRDFRGIPKKCFDGCGNLTIGIKEHIVFPEINPEEVKQIFGFEITIATTAKNNQEGIKLLKSLGFPIKD
ncbi:MAG: 50S ribosomal protein L5 [bacterium]